MPIYNLIKVKGGDSGIKGLILLCFTNLVMDRLNENQWK